MAFVVGLPNLNYFALSPSVAIAAEYIIDREGGTNKVLTAPLPRSVHVAVWNKDMVKKNRAVVSLSPLSVDKLPFASDADKALLVGALTELIAQRGVVEN